MNTSQRFWGRGKVFLVSCCHCFFVAFSIYATARHDYWVYNYQAEHFGVIMEKFSSAQLGMRRQLDCKPLIRPLHTPEAHVVHGAAGEKGLASGSRELPSGSPSLLWASVSSSLKWQSRVSRSLKAPWLCLSQILYSVEQKVHDAFKSTKNL